MKCDVIAVCVMTTYSSLHIARHENASLRIFTMHDLMTTCPLVNKVDTSVPILVVNNDILHSMSRQNMYSYSEQTIENWDKCHGNTNGGWDLLVSGLYQFTATHRDKYCFATCWSSRLNWLLTRALLVNSITIPFKKGGAYSFFRETLSNKNGFLKAFRVGLLYLGRPNYFRGGSNWCKITFKSIALSVIHYERHDKDLLFLYTNTLSRCNSCIFSFPPNKAAPS